MKIQFPCAYRIYAKKEGKKAAPIHRSIWGIRTANNLIEADIFEVLNTGDKIAFEEFLAWLNNGEAPEYTFTARKVKNWLLPNG